MIRDWKSTGPFTVPNEARAPGRFDALWRLPASIASGLLMLCIMGGMALGGWWNGRKA